MRRKEGKTEGNRDGAARRRGRGRRGRGPRWSRRCGRTWSAGWRGPGPPAARAAARSPPARRGTGAPPPAPPRRPRPSPPAAQSGPRRSPARYLRVGWGDSAGGDDREKGKEEWGRGAVLYIANQSTTHHLLHLPCIPSLHGRRSRSCTDSPFAVAAMASYMCMCAPVGTSLQSRCTRRGTCRPNDSVERSVPSFANSRAILWEGPGCLHLRTCHQFLYPLCSANTPIRTSSCIGVIQEAPVLLHECLIVLIKKIIQFTVQTLLPSRFFFLILLFLLNMLHSLFFCLVILIQLISLCLC